MAEKIKISDLFDFSDVQDLETLYRRLEQINEIYKKLAQNINQESKTINKGLEENVKEVEKLATALKTASQAADIKKLSDAIEKQAAVNKKLTEQNEKLTEQNKKLKDSQKAVNEEGKEAERLLKEQERLKARISKATGEEAKQNAILKLELQRVNKETKEQAKAASGLETAYERLRRRTAEAKKEALEIGAQLGRTSTEFQEATKRANKLSEELRGLNNDIGNFQDNVGNYQSALDGIKEGFSNITAFAGPAAIALAAVSLTVEGISALAETVQETNTQLKETAQLTGLNGEALTTYTGQVRATAKVFDQEYKEVLRAANAVSKEFGITGSEALDLINSGFVQGANINDDYLDQLREYSTQFKAAGLSAQDFNNVVALGAKEGIFNDKAADTVKEAGLRLREFTKATEDSLQPLGKLRNEQIKQAVAAGESFKAIQLVSQGLKEVDLTAQQTQSIITNTFGGPGEDAGLRFIQLLSEIDTNQQNINANLTEQQKQQLRILEIEEELSNAEVRLGEAFKNSGKEISLFFKQLQTVGIEGIILAVEEVKDIFNELAPSFNEVGSAIDELADSLGLTGSGFIEFIKRVNPLRRIIDNSIEGVKALINIFVFLVNSFKNISIVVQDTATAIKDFALSFDFVSQIVDGFTILLDDLFGLFANFPKLLSGVAEAFSEFFNQLEIRFRSTFTNFKDALTGLFTLDLDLLKQALSSQTTQITGLGREVAKAFEKGYNEGPTVTKIVTEDVKQANKVVQEAQKEQAAQTKEQQKKNQDAQDKALQERLKAIDDAITKERIKLKEQRADRLITEEQFEDELIILKLEKLEQQKEALEKAGKDTLAIEEQINDILLAEQKKGEKEGLEQQKEADKESLRLKKEADKAKLDAEREAQEQREALASDPIVQAGFDALESRIQNELVLAGVQAFRSALEQGKTAQEALTDGTKAVAAAQVFKSLSKGFHDAGYTGDGGEWDVAGVVHKGEMVQTAKQTKKYGMRGWSANDFDSAIENGYFNQFAKTNLDLADQMNYNHNIVVNNDNSAVVDAIKDLPNKMPTEQLKSLAGHLQHQQKIGSRKINTTYKYGRSCR